MAIALAILVPPFVTYSDVLFGATENQERASAAAASCGLEDAGWGRVPPPGGKDDTFLAGPAACRSFFSSQIAPAASC